jgi:hypothetical protein
MLFFDKNETSRRYRCSVRRLEKGKFLKVKIHKEEQLRYEIFCSSKFLKLFHGVSYIIAMKPSLHKKARIIRSRQYQLNSTLWPLVRKRTIPTELPPLVEEI